MKHALVLTLALFTFSCSTNPAPTAHDSTSGDHATFLPDQIPWKADPPSLPPGAKFAVLEGDPSKPGYFAMRAILPANYEIPAHWHPAAERLTVLSGTLYLGTGDHFDRAAAHPLPTGTYASMPPGMRHFAYTREPCTLQITTLGPWGVTYVNPADDPRKGK